MSNLFQRQLSQGDQVNLQSPLALASLQNISNKHVNVFSPSHGKTNQAKLSQVPPNHHLYSLSNASSEMSQMESSTYMNNNCQPLHPFANNQQGSYSTNKENSSPIFFRQQFSGSSKNENSSCYNENINPTKLFTQEFLNMNKQKIQHTPRSPLSQQQFNPSHNNIQPQQNFKKGYDAQKSINARNDYFNSLKGTSQQQQQYLYNQNGLGREDKDSVSEFSSNQNLYDINGANLNNQENNNYYSIPSASPTPRSIPNSSGNNSNVYQNSFEKQSSISNIPYKLDPLERPLSMILENAIGKAIYQSERVINPQNSQMNISKQSSFNHRQSTPEILVEDFAQNSISQQPSLIFPNTFSHSSSLSNNNYTPKNAINYCLFQPQQSVKNTSNVSNMSILNNMNQNNSCIQENCNYEFKPPQSPLNQQKQNINISTHSPNNLQNGQNQKGRLTLVERQSSRSPAKSSHHINCKYPHGDLNDSQIHGSKKKGNAILNNSQLNNQQPSLTRSKSNNSIVTQHNYLKKQTRNGSPQNITLNTQNSFGQSTSCSKISNLDKTVPQSRSNNQYNFNNNFNKQYHQSDYQVKNNNSTTPNKRDLDTSMSKKSATPIKQQQQQIQQQQKHVQNNTTSNSNQFISHQQNISTLVPNIEIYDQQCQNYQQNLNMTPRSLSNITVQQSPFQYQQQQAYSVTSIPYNTNGYAPQSPITRQQSLTPRTPLNNEQKINAFPNDINQMEQIISNYDVQSFLKRHFLVGETTQRLICDSWHSIPIVYFIKLLITEFPEVLEDHQIGESLLTELKEKILLLIQDDENNDLNYTKTTGLLGLILKALKELSSEEKTKLSNINNQPSQIQNDNQVYLEQQQQGHTASFYSQQGINSFAIPSQQNFFENFKTVFQNTIEKNTVQYHLQSKDVQNIMNIIQEFVEGLYRDMENEIYSKFNVEMRRMMVKFKETESMLKVVSEKITDNYGLFQQEASQVKKIKQLQQDKNELIEQNSMKDLEIQKLALVIESLSIENSKLTHENDKLHEKCEKYLEFGMRNVQTLCDNNLQDQYKQLVQQQKTFFEQQVKQLEEYKVRQSLSKKDIQQLKVDKKGQTNTSKGSKTSNPHLQTELSDTESCNLSYALMTLEDQSTPLGGPFQSSSKIPQSAIKALTQYEVHQNQNAFKRNKTEGQTLEPVMMDNSQFFDSSDKFSLFRALNVFISQSQIRDFVSLNKKSNFSPALPGLPNSNFGSFAVNAAAITGKYGAQQRTDSACMPMNLEQAMEKLQGLIEILPLIREVRLLNYEQIFNYMKYLYTLQMYIYSQVDYKEQLNDQDDHLRKHALHISSIPMNKCWKKILAEHNNKDYFCSFTEQNSAQSFTQFNQQNSPLSTKTYTLQPSSSSSCLTPKAKPDIFAIQKICHNQMTQQNNQQNEHQSSNTSHTNIESRFHPNHLIINNQGIIDILIFVLNQHLSKITTCERQNQNSDDKAKYFLLKMLIYLNTLIISNNKNDIQSVLNRFFTEIQQQLRHSLISDFVRDNNVLDVILLSLRNINFANSSTVQEALKFLISFKQASSNYMSFIRQLSQENNMTALLQLLECQFDSRNILMALNLIKNVSYSINFKENIQAKITQVLDQIQKRTCENSEKEIEDIAKVIRSNINCGVNIRTISLTPSQSNIAVVAATKQN